MSRSQPAPLSSSERSRNLKIILGLDIVRDLISLSLSMSASGDLLRAHNVRAARVGAVPEIILRGLGWRATGFFRRVGVSCVLGVSGGWTGIMNEAVLGVGVETALMMNQL